MLFRSLYWGLCIAHQTGSASLLLTRGGAFHPEGLLPIQWKNYLTFIASCVFESYVGLHSINCVKFAIGIGYLYYIRMAQTLSRIWKKHEEDPTHAVQEHKGLQILNICFNNSLGAVFVPVVKTAVEIEAPVAIALSFKFSHDGASIPFLAMTLTFSVVATINEFAPMLPLAKIHELSKAFVDSKSTGKEKYERALKRSCRVLRNQVGMLYYVDRQLILTMLKNKIDAVVFLLLNI